MVKLPFSVKFKKFPTTFGSLFLVGIIFFLVQWTCCEIEPGRGYRVDISSMHRNLTQQQKQPNSTRKIPLIYVITPTIYRVERKADLVRLSQTLRLVPRIHWIVVEDKSNRSHSVAKVLANCKIPYTHLAIKSSRLEMARIKATLVLREFWKFPSGVEQRNLGLDWITKNIEFPSVFYHADDDNTYDVRIFEEMRYTKKISVWPVAIVGKALFETPVVRQGKVIGFAAGWKPQRKFAFDMAAFAVNTTFLMRTDPPRFSLVAGRGYIETDFVEQLNVTIDELEPKAKNCSEILVWHTKTASSPRSNDHILKSLTYKYNVKQFEI